LVDLAQDNTLGRRISSQPEVNDRTRAFACYGLGLLAYENGLEVKRRVFDSVKDFGIRR